MNRINNVIDAFIINYGFNPENIYCQVTGKPIGRFETEEFEAIVDELQGDDESAADDLAMRILASLRPSLRWNKFRDTTLVDMRVKHPVETLAYLVNRLFHPLNHRKTAIGDLLRFYEQRIKAFAMLSEWGVNDSTNTLTYLLLELDAKWNLDTEWAPFSWDDFFNAESMSHRIELLQKWQERRIADWDKKMAALEYQTKWSRTGNAIAKPAYASAYMENRPVSKVEIKKQEKRKESAFFAGLLAEIQGERPSTEEAVATQPDVKFVPIKKMPFKFGVK